jgi:hypothetical protein
MNPQLKNYIHVICCNVDPNDVKLSHQIQIYFDYLIRNGIATARLGHRGFEAV